VHIAARLGAGCLEYTVLSPSSPLSFGFLVHMLCPIARDRRTENIRENVYKWCIWVRRYHIDIFLTCARWKFYCDPNTINKKLNIYADGQRGWRAGRCRNLFQDRVSFKFSYLRHFKKLRKLSAIFREGTFMTASKWMLRILSLSDQILNVNSWLRVYIDRANVKRFSNGLNFNQATSFE